MSQEPVKLREVIAPRYWPAWIGIALLRLAILLPFKAQVALGKGVGRLLLPLATKRVDIARANIRHCFPALDEREREALVKRHVESLGIALFETAMTWWGKRSKLDRWIKRLDGLEHIEAARAEGKGIILLSAHFTTLDIGGRLIVDKCSFAPVYRRMNSLLQEYFTQQGRSRGSDGAIPHTNMKGIIRHLKNGGAIWFGSDQQHQGNNSALVDFMGQPAHSATGTSTIARLGKAAVIPFFTRRTDEGYEIEFQPALDNFPSGDDAADTARYHRLIEAQIAKAPEQYLWVHRRFKDAPNHPY